VRRVIDYGMVLDDPQIQNKEMVLVLNHSLAGTIKVQGSPIWMDSEKCVTKFPPPALGEHSQDILYEYGCIMRAEQISDPHGHL
ncbi:MAG: CoA transferase, partial [Candidatus Nanopelagicales bacterium]